MVYKLTNPFSCMFNFLHPECFMALPRRCFKTRQKINYLYGRSIRSYGNLQNPKTRIYAIQHSYICLLNTKILSYVSFEYVRTLILRQLKIELAALYILSSIVVTSSRCICIANLVILAVCSKVKIAAATASVILWLCIFTRISRRISCLPSVSFIWHGF